MKRSTKKFSRNRSFAGKALRNAAFKQRIVPSGKVYIRKAKHKYETNRPTLDSMKGYSNDYEASRSH
tara:strand:- start:147 stop:347 length:201 start_codon:yes stop_codon:yes gene_type:complete